MHKGPRLAAMTAACLLGISSLALAACGRNSATPTSSESASSTASASATPSESTESATPSSTATVGTAMSAKEYADLIVMTRTGAGASVSFSSTVTGAVTARQSFTGNVDVDSGAGSGQATSGSSAPSERIVLGSVVYTKATVRWIPTALKGKGIAAGDILGLWKLLGKAVDVRKTGTATVTITGALPAAELIDSLGAAADASGAISAAAAGESAQLTLKVDSDGFITSVAVTATVNVDGTPTTAALRATLNDYGQIVDVRKPATEPVQTPEGQ